MANAPSHVSVDRHSCTRLCMILDVTDSLFAELPTRRLNDMRPLVLTDLSDTVIPPLAMRWGTTSVHVLLMTYGCVVKYHRGH